jgi:23S rRNA pseudouridine1911/1915/1917 synthase
MADREEKELQLTVPDDFRTDRADKILARIHPELSRSRWQKLFQAGRVWQDERVLAQKSRLRPGDVVDFSIPALKPLELRPVAMDLQILHEDDDLLVIDKEPGLVVHPGAGTGEDTLVHGILHHCKGQLSGIGGKERPGIVHRLDKETSGLLLVAKSDAAFQCLADQFANRTVRKYYTALVRGVPQPGQGRIEAPIGRHSVHRVRMAVREDGRHALTDYEVEEQWGFASQVGLQIHTGRTHQIRVHLKHLGFPVLGDKLYGYKPLQITGFPDIPRVMLHATRLEFEHPVTGMAMEMEAPLPADFVAVISALVDLPPPAESR